MYRSSSLTRELPLNPRDIRKITKHENSDQFAFVSQIEYRDQVDT